MSNNVNKNSRNTRNTKSTNTKGKRSEQVSPRNGECVVPEKEVNRRKLKNDPNWYFTDKELMDESSYFAFNQFIGTELGNDSTGYEVPAIMSLAFNPSPGVTKYGNRSGINMAGFKLYTQLSMKSGRTMNYAPQDVTTLMLGLGEVMSMTEYARRCFAVTFTYSARNRAYPKRMLQAMGIEPDDFFANYSTYRMKLNTIINQLNKVPFPVNFAYFAKCQAMYKDIYLDADSSMAQSYVFVPDTTWILDEESYEQGTILKTVKGPAKASTASTDPAVSYFSYVINIIDSQVSALLNSTTLNYIYADILNFVGANNVPLFAVNLIDEDYRITPIFNEAVLEQIHNLQPTGNVVEDATAAVPASTKSNNVYPDVNNNCVKYNPVFDSGTINYNTFLLDFYDSNPDVVRRVEASRYKAVAGQKKVDGNKTYYFDCTLPDHYCTKMKIWTSDTVISYDAPFNYDATKDTVTPGSQILHLTQFDYAPFFMIFGKDGNHTGIVGDLNYYTQLDIDYLRRVNEVAALGLFELR